MALQNNITMLQDISDDEFELVRRYFALMNTGAMEDFNSARNLVTANPELNFSLLNENIFNLLVVALGSADVSKGLEYYVINYMNTNITLVLADLLTTYQLHIDSLRNSGNWINNISYKVNNAVRYSVNSLYYYAIADVPIGTLPTNTTYWVNVRMSENDSFQNVRLNTINTIYNTSVSYPINSLVTNSEQSTVYISKIANNIGHSLNDTNFWKIFIGLGAWKLDGKPDIEQGQGIPIVSVKPNNGQEGDLIWLIINS